MNKKDIRKAVLAKRDILEQQNKKAMDEAIFNKIVKLKEYNEAESIFIFISFGSEVDTHRIINHALERGKRVAVPRINKAKKAMELKVIKSLDNLKPALYGILEPGEEAEDIEPDELGLIIMPGVAFDLSGGRIGYGGGYYDRFLNEAKETTPRVALAYELQIVDILPLEPFDKKIHGLITEQRNIWF